MRKYAPIPAPGLGTLVRRLRYGAPQLRPGIDAALARAKRRLGHARVDGIDWYWPASEQPGAAREAPDDSVRFLAPFDPVVWDRARFERFFGWTYRFESYTPAARRKLGYYALPLLWRDTMPGWANVSVKRGRLAVDIGFVRKPPRARAFRSELEREVERMREFLGL